MAENPKRRSSLVSSGARVQFAVGVALISIIPLLTFWYLNVTSGYQDGYPYMALVVVIPVVVAAGLGGYVILRKYPLNIVRLRGYLEDMIRGEMPDHIKLVKHEDDIAAVEKCLNLIVEQLKERLEILKMLVENAEQPVERNKLLDVIWGLEGFPTTRTVDNHIVSLRRKIEPDPKNPRHILTVHSIGYRFVP